MFMTVHNDLTSRIRIDLIINYNDSGGVTNDFYLALELYTLNLRHAVRHLISANFMCSVSTICVNAKCGV